MTSCPFLFEKNNPTTLSVQCWNTIKLDNPMTTLKRLFCLFSYLNFHSKTYWYYCDNETQRLVFRDIRDAIPIPENLKSSGGVDIGAQNLMGDAVGLNAQWQLQVQPLIESLSEKAVDRYRISHEKVFAYHINPCGHDQFYLKNLEKETHEYYELEKFRDSIRALILYAKINPEDPKNAELLEDICNQMLGKSNKICIKKVFRESQEIMNELINKGGPDAS